MLRVIMMCEDNRFNRTFMELKCDKSHVPTTSLLRFNRTFMELK